MVNQNDLPHDERVAEEFVDFSFGELLAEAEAENSRAMVSLAALYKRDGNEPEQERWLHRAVTLGNTHGMRRLGQALYNRGDRALALELFHRALSLGDDLATVALGQIAELERNFSEAISWFEKAAENGDARAMGLLGIRLYSANRLDDAREWFLKGSELADNTCIVCMGLDCVALKKPEEAKQWFLKALGHNTASDQRTMVHLANVFLSQSEIESAMNWFVKAAAMGSISAALEVGRRSKGRENWEEARAYFLQVAQSKAASKQELAEAMFELANLAQRGGNAVDAEKWSRQAMENGSIEGLGHLLRSAPQIALSGS